MNKASKILIVFMASIATTIAHAGECVFSLHGKCYDCNTQYALKVGSKDNCEINCPNRIYIFEDRTCRLKFGESIAMPQPNDTSVDIKNCTLKSGEENKFRKGTVEHYFKGGNGKCYSCKTTEQVKILPQSCKKERFCNENCSQRSKKYSNDSTTLYSVLKCPSDRPLMDNFMMCWRCDEKTPIDLSFNQNFNSLCKKQRSINQDEAPFSYLKQ
jgi:hypothetical protein